MALIQSGFIYFIQQIVELKKLISNLQNDIESETNQLRRATQDLDINRRDTNEARDVVVDGGWWILTGPVLVLRIAHALDEVNMHIKIIWLS